MSFLFLFLFFGRYLGFCILGGYMGLERPHIFWEKKKKRKRLGRGTLNTCVKFQGLTLKNGVDIWIFVRLSAKFTAWHRGVIKYSILGVKFDLILVLRSQFFELLRETLYKHALEHLEAAPPGKNG